VRESYLLYHEELEALCRRIRENSERVYGQW